MKKGRIEHEGWTYWYEHRPAKDGEICLGTMNPEEYCNGVYVYSSKDPGDGMAFVVTDTDNTNLVLTPNTYQQLNRTDNETPHD